MTPKERFLAAIRKRQPDKVPVFDYLFSQDLFEYVLGIRPEVYDFKLAIDLAAALGHDAVWAPNMTAASSKKDNAAQVYSDEWGTVYKKESISWPSDAPIDYPVKCRRDFENLDIPDASLPERYVSLEAAVKYAGEHGKIAVLGSLLGPFSLAWLLMGPEYLLLAMYKEPDLVDDIFKAYIRYALPCIRKNSECGIDGLIIAEDLGYETGVFYSPELMRENLFPYLKEMADEAHNLGLPVILHCDGNVNAILQDFVEIGFDALHPLERKCHMNLREIKRKYGDKLCLIGNVDSCRTLAFGTLDEVEAETVNCLRDGAEGGGYVLASDHSLSMGIKIENVMKMYETHRKYGTYPIPLLDNKEQG